MWINWEARCKKQQNLSYHFPMNEPMAMIFDNLGACQNPLSLFLVRTLYWPSWFTVIWLIAAWAHPTSKVDSLTKQLYPLCDCNVPKCLSCHMSPPNEGFFHPPCPNKGHLSKICMVLLERPLKCGDCFLQEFEWSLLGIIFKIWWKLMVLWVGQMTSCFGDLYSFDCLKIEKRGLGALSLWTW